MTKYKLLNLMTAEYVATVHGTVIYFTEEQTKSQLLINLICAHNGTTCPLEFEFIGEPDA